MDNEPLTAEELNEFEAHIGEMPRIGPPQGIARRLLAAARRCAEAERCAKRLWLHEWVDDRIFLRSESCELDLGRALRLVRRVPAPVDLDADMTFTDGQPGFHDDAEQRLRCFVDELVDLLTKKPVLSRHASEGEEAENVQ